MAAFSVTLNGKAFVRVATDGFDVMDVGVSGDLLGPEHATLRISGGSYPEGRGSQYLIWEDERTLVPGDTVTVAFLADGITSRPGKTIEELYPDEKPTHIEPFAAAEEMVRELKQRPKAFESLAFEFTGPDGGVVQANTDPIEHGYGFTVLWNSHRPERARASAHTYTLTVSLRKRTASTTQKPSSYLVRAFHSGCWRLTARCRPTPPLRRYALSGARQSTDARRTGSAMPTAIILPAIALVLLTASCGSVFTSSESASFGYRRAQNQPATLPPEEKVGALLQQLTSELGKIPGVAFVD